MAAHGVLAHSCCAVAPAIEQPGLQCTGMVEQTTPECSSINAQHFQGRTGSEVCGEPCALVDRMSDSVGGAGNSGGAGGSCGVGGASGAGGASDVGGTESCASNAEASAAVDGAMNDVSGPEVSAAAQSVSGAVDGYEAPSAPAQEAGICIGTESECAKAAADRAQREADAMTDEQAMKALDGAFLHDPTSLTPAQVKGLEALSRQETLHETTRNQIRDFLSDHYHNTDRLGFYGQL